MFQYVLFDLDGTLTDPKEGITKSVQFALYQQGIQESNLDKLEPFIGPPLKDSFMNYYGLTQEQALIAIEDYRKRFAPIGIFENKVYPGIPEMLEHLKGAGMRLAVASSKPEVFVRRILEHFHLADYFDVIVGSNLDGTRTEKEEVVEEALRQLGLPSEINKITCAMVGDRKFDIQGAREHGLTAVGVSYGYAGKGELETAGPDYIAKTVKQLEQFLLQTPKAETIKKDKEYSRAHFLKTFDILNCVLIYYIGYYVCGFMVTLICLLVSGMAESATIWIQQHNELVTNFTRACSMLGGAGFLLPVFRKEESRRHMEEQAERGGGKAKIPFLRLGILAGTGALGINILFYLLQFTGMSAAYEQTAQVQYRVPFLFGILFYGLVSPFAEELLFRGILYNRIKSYFPLRTSMIASSAMFGIYHGNLVQAVYGLLLGLLIVYGYEKTGKLIVPVFMHSIANIVVFSCTYNTAIGEAIGTPLNGIVLLLIFCFTFLRFEKIQ